MQKRTSYPDITYLLHRTASGLAHASDQALLSELAVGFAQFKILRALADNDGVQQKQIALLLGQTEASISRQIRLMETEGLLDVEINPANRRERIVSLTTDGTKCLKQAQEIVARVHAPVIGVLSASQQAQFANMLHRISC
jgi:DNA-binding MarR family transcriptional regulator